MKSWAQGLKQWGLWLLGEGSLPDTRARKMLAGTLAAVVVLVAAGLLVVGGSSKTNTASHNSTNLAAAAGSGSAGTDDSSGDSSDSGSSGSGGTTGSTSKSGKSHSARGSHTHAWTPHSSTKSNHSKTPHTLPSTGTAAGSSPPNYLPAIISLGHSLPTFRRVAATCRPDTTRGAERVVPRIRPTCRGPGRASHRSFRTDGAEGHRQPRLVARVVESRLRRGFRDRRLQRVHGDRLGSGETDSLKRWHLDQRELRLLHGPGSRRRAAVLLRRGRGQCSRVVAALQRGDVCFVAGVQAGGVVGDTGRGDGLQLSGQRVLAGQLLGAVSTARTGTNYGSTSGWKLAAPIDQIVSTPDGKGYWLVGSDGGIFSFGDAGFYGSMSGTTLNSNIVGMAPTPTARATGRSEATVGSSPSASAGLLGSMGGVRW